MTSQPHVQAQLTLLNSMGLHARAAAAFVQAIKDFTVEVTVTRQGQTANGRSVIELLTLGAPQGSTLDIQIQGVDSEKALATLTNLINNRFYEE